MTLKNIDHLVGLKGNANNDQTQNTNDVTLKNIDYWVGLKGIANDD